MNFMLTFCEFNDRRQEMIVKIGAMTSRKNIRGNIQRIVGQGKEKMLLSLKEM